MNKTINEDYEEKLQVVAKVCGFLKLHKPTKIDISTIELIKKLCVKRLCKSIGISGTYNYKSDFFDFFANIMGEALCEKLEIKKHIACEELRLVKYEHVNLVEEMKSFIDNEDLEEAFLDAFNLADRFKYLIKDLKKV